MRPILGSGVQPLVMRRSVTLFPRASPGAEKHGMELITFWAYGRAHETTEEGQALQERWFPELGGR